MTPMSVEDQLNELRAAIDADIRSIECIYPSTKGALYGEPRTRLACKIAAKFENVLAELSRYTALPPEVAAAMEEYSRGCCMDSNALTIAAHFTAFYHPIPKVSP